MLIKVHAGLLGCRNFFILVGNFSDVEDAIIVGTAKNRLACCRRSASASAGIGWVRISVMSVC
jgi:hypothetical protein